MTLQIRISISSINTSELNNLEKIEKEYQHHRPIWWYTYSCFLYSMLNRALRTMELDLIIMMGFFVRDLLNHIATLHAEQYGREHQLDCFTVYRGQGLSQTDFNQMKETQGGLISFNNFLSTSLDRAVSFAFAESNQYNSELIGVLFEININPSISSFSFANVRNVGYYPEEEEILFSMHSVFRIGKMKQIEDNDRLWQVNLTLTNDSDPQLQALTKNIQEETEAPTGWHRLGKLMLRLGELKRVQELYEILLKQATSDDEKGGIYIMLGEVKFLQGQYAETLTYHEKSIEIRRKFLPVNHPDFATNYNSIGLVYKKMGEYWKALLYYTKALEIRKKTLPANHIHLAISYNNNGSVYNNMGEYAKALSSCEKSFEIYQKILPANHPDFATCYANIGVLYNKMGEYSNALLHFEKAFEIQQKILPANHADLGISYNNIGAIYDNMGEYSKALSSYEKALAIRQKVLVANHPDLATSYNNIGVVYYKMDEYSKALSYYEKALKIRQEILPANHPDFAQSYNNIGLTYNKIGEYSKALSYYEKALEIQQIILPANHPRFAYHCRDIGVVFYKMGEYSKALSYLERALNIFQCSLPSNHPHLKTVRKTIKSVKKKL